MDSPIPDALTEESPEALQSLISDLESRLKATERSLKRCKDEEVLRSNGVRRCTERNAALQCECDDLLHRCGQLQEKCDLSEPEKKSIVAACVRFHNENRRFLMALRDPNPIAEFVDEVESLMKEKERLSMQLLATEEELVVLSINCIILDEVDKDLLRQMNEIIAFQVQGLYVSRQDGAHS